MKKIWSLASAIIFLLLIALSVNAIWGIGHSEKPLKDFEKIEIGNRKLTYVDIAGVERDIPFYIELKLTSATEDTFVVDNVVFYYRCSTTDVRVSVKDGDYLNGKRVTIDANSNLTTDFGPVRLDANFSSILNIGGVSYDFQIWNKTEKTLYLTADGNCQISSESWVGIPTYLKMGGRTPVWNTIFYDDNNSAQNRLNERLVTIEVTKPGTLSDTYKYVPYANEIYGKMYLLLQKDTKFSDQYSGVDLSLLGTDVDEDGAIDFDMYVPDKPAFGNDPSDNDYLVASIRVSTASADIYSYIDAATGSLIVLPNEQLNYYEGKVSYPTKNGIKYLNSGWAKTIDGSRILISEDGKSSAIFVRKK